MVYKIVLGLLLLSTSPLFAYPYDWATGVVDSSCTIQDICPHLNPVTRKRPSTEYTNGLKKKQLIDNPGIDCSKGCEEDHVISLELCGDPKDPENLSPEPYAKPYGAKEKDQVEDYLHKQVCSGAMTLKEAQHAIVYHWLDIYQSNEHSR